VTSGPPPNNPLQSNKGNLTKGLESAAVLQAKVQKGTCNDRFAPADLVIGVPCRWGIRAESLDQRAV
jgi:hypothetical protein